MYNKQLYGKKTGGKQIVLDADTGHAYVVQPKNSRTIGSKPRRTRRYSDE